MGYSQIYWLYVVTMTICPIKVDINSKMFTLNTLFGVCSEHRGNPSPERLVDVLRSQKCRPAWPLAEQGIKLTAVSSNEPSGALMQPPSYPNASSIWPAAVTRWTWCTRLQWYFHTSLGGCGVWWQGDAFESFPSTLGCRTPESFTTEWKKRLCLSIAAWTDSTLQFSMTDSQKSIFKWQNLDMLHMQKCYIWYMCKQHAQKKFLFTFHTTVPSKASR